MSGASSPAIAFSNLSGLLGLSSIFAAVSRHSYVLDSVKLLLLGTLVEAGRRLLGWVIERFKLRYYITARFEAGDPAYDWVNTFLAREKVWRRSSDFNVSAKSSKRKWGVSTGESDSSVLGSAEYIPTYEQPALFRWRGYWVEVKRGTVVPSSGSGNVQSAEALWVTVYTLNMKALSALVEEAKSGYTEVSSSSIIVHTVDTPYRGGPFMWNNVKSKKRRPLDSIVLEEGVMDSLVLDAKDFIDSEAWYAQAGIPHRRGYLLHGPPGSGKSSTIYALAGELGLEIYSISLASSFVDDAYLSRAASSIPKHSIFLLEDIDCAFSSREDEFDDYDCGFPSPDSMVPRKASSVTLSGLLNVIDGVGSEEGKLFFATTNYVDRLDSALVRPGRIDMKIEYRLSSRAQAKALFNRFFPPSVKSKEAKRPPTKTTSPEPEPEADPDVLSALATAFADSLPENALSTAELQGHLLAYKNRPRAAAAAARAWAEGILTDRSARAARLGRNSARGVGTVFVGNPPLGRAAARDTRGPRAGSLRGATTPLSPSPAYSLGPAEDEKKMGGDATCDDVEAHIRRFCVPL